MKRVGILGASGYTGAELVRLLTGHPELELCWVGAREKAGQRLGQVIPSSEGVAGLSELVLSSFEPERAASARAGQALLEAGLTVVDLSADFRLKDASTYARAYGEHPAPELLARSVYGLPELHRAELPGARLIAAPGCYPTSAILPLAPLLSEGLIEHAPIVIDAKSGVSGAGRTPSASTHYPETAEGIRPYKVAGSHRHVPEIEQELSAAAGADIKVVFTPHLVPMSRGIFTAAYGRVKPGVTADRCRQAARALYEGGLVSVLSEDRLPDTLWVRGSARAHVAYAIDEHAGVAIAMCAIDNLARGASAQAIQALNVSLGFRDGLGLPEVGLFP